MFGGRTLRASPEFAQDLNGPGESGIWELWEVGGPSESSATGVEEWKGPLYCMQSSTLTSSYHKTSHCLLAAQPVTAATHWHHLHFKPAGDRVLRDKPVIFAE